MELVESEASGRDTLRSDSLQSGSDPHSSSSTDPSPPSGDVSNDKNTNPKEQPDRSSDFQTTKRSSKLLRSSSSSAELLISKQQNDKEIAIAAKQNCEETANNVINFESNKILRSESKNVKEIGRDLDGNPLRAGLEVVLVMLLPEGEEF